MPITNIVIGSEGLVGVKPRRIWIESNDAIDTLLDIGYLNPYVSYGIEHGDLAFISLLDGHCAVLQVDKTAANWSLKATDNAGNVTVPTTVNYLAHATDIDGTLSTAAATVTNQGDIHAGKDASAGAFVSYPGTTISGTFKFAATNNTSGNFTTTLTNAAAIGQSQSVSIPDVGEATGGVVVKGSSAFTTNALIKASGTAGLVTNAGMTSSAGELNLTTQGKTFGVVGGGAATVGGSTAAMTAGAVTVNTTSALDTSYIGVTRVVSGGTLGNVTVSVDNGVSFTITSDSNTETSQFKYIILNIN